MGDRGSYAILTQNFSGEEAMEVEKRTEPKLWAFMGPRSLAKEVQLSRKDAVNPNGGKFSFYDSSGLTVGMGTLTCPPGAVQTRSFLRSGKVFRAARSSQGRAFLARAKRPLTARTALGEFPREGMALPLFYIAIGGNQR
jgi:hypothetical protein